MFRDIACLVLIFSVVIILAKGSPGYFDVNTTPILNKNGQSFQQIPSSCAEAVAEENMTSGIFLLQVPNHLDPFYVNCIKDPWGGDPWTLIQRRKCGLVDFHRGAYEYGTGFGNLNGEHFLGLKKLSAITTSKTHELWVQLEDFEGDQRYAKYSNFTVGDYRANYTLYSIGIYNGTAGNALNNHVGAPFITKDVNYDKSCANKAESHKGAWWYRCNQSHSSHLNGQYYGSGMAVPYENGINWLPFRGDYYSLKYAHMAIRPRT